MFLKKKLQRKYMFKIAFSHFGCSKFAKVSNMAKNWLERDSILLIIWKIKISHVVISSRFLLHIFPLLVPQKKGRKKTPPFSQQPTKRHMGNFLALMFIITIIQNYFVSKSTKDMADNDVRMLLEYTGPEFSTHLLKEKQDPHFSVKTLGSPRQNSTQNLAQLTLVDVSKYLSI